MLNYCSIVIFVLTCSVSTVKAQTGLFGKNNAVEFSYSLAPSIKSKKVLITQKTVGDKYRLINNSFAISYKRIISNSLSLSVGYDFAKIRSFTSSIVSRNISELETYFDEFSQTFVTNYFNKDYAWNFIQPKFSYNAITFGLDYFDDNSINPVGILWGLNLEVGKLNASFDNVVVFNTSIYGGPNSPVVDNSIREVSLDSASRTYTTALFKGVIGKNIIISRSLMINFSLEANLLSFIKGGNQHRSSADFFEVLDNSGNNTIYLHSYTESLLIESAYAALLSYKRFSMSAGLSYYF